MLIWLVLGCIGWLGALALGAALWNADPRAAGFDWRLVVEAGARVAAGQSPYDPALLSGAPDLAAVDLFYSYPPPVAQAAALIASTPLLVSLLVLDAVAVIGALVVADRLAARRTDLTPIDVVVPVLAVLPLLFPVTIALVFGNVDVLYPLLYGAVLIAATAGAGTRTAVAGGIALGIATVAKIHPAGVGLWLMVRGLRERRDSVPARAWRILAAALVTGLAAIGLSLVVGGTGPWLDYGRVVGVASGADVVVRANIGPAAQIALLAGLGEETARALHLVVVALAAGATAWAAWSIRDTLVSLAVSATASLVLLPITWYHYPPALVPFAIAALMRARDSGRGREIALLVATAGVVASAAAALPVAIWLAVALVVAATARSVPAAQPTVSRPSGTTVPSGA
jgi:hypothetical protein